MALNAGRGKEVGVSSIWALARAMIPQMPFMVILVNLRETGRSSGTCPCSPHGAQALASSHSLQGLRVALAAHSAQRAPTLMAETGRSPAEAGLLSL